MDKSKHKIGTKVIHAGQSPEPITGAVMPPIFTTSTYVQPSPGQHTGFEYTRAQNPTRYALERMVAGLEGSGLTVEQDETNGGFAFASGLAAMATVLDLLESGSRVLAMDDLYGGSGRLFSRVRAHSQGLDVVRADLSDADALRANMTPDTKLVWVETPTNPMMKIADLAQIADICKQINPDVILACDNTFASPINQRPFEHGFDISMHSTTKYLNGHSDSIGGVLITNSVDLAGKLRFLQMAVGSVMSPFDAYLVLRGIKTLDVRMERHNKTGLKIARWLESHATVESVIYPGLEAHPQHAEAKKQMSGFTGMVSFTIKGGLDAAKAMLESVRLFALAESLGGVESLIEHPAIMTHASVPAEMREQLGISDGLIRLSCGIEDADDLIADLDQALTAGARACANSGAAAKA
jgi:cystathionine gamma-lyase